jgi:hypothetical protein
MPTFDIEHGKQKAQPGLQTDLADYFDSAWFCFAGTTSGKSARSLVLADLFVSGLDSLLSKAHESTRRTQWLLHATAVSICTMAVIFEQGHVIASAKNTRIG